MPPTPTSTINVTDVANECRQRVIDYVGGKPACIETSWLFSEVMKAIDPEMNIRRVVTQAQSFSPNVVESLDAGMPPEQLQKIMHLEGYWSVSVGVYKDRIFGGRNDKGSTLTGAWRGMTSLLPAFVI